MASWFEEQVQQAAASRGEAVNQCPECRAFRLDGKPPTVHRTGCTRSVKEEERTDG